MSRPGLPICLVTGFLGAGKTTLLNHILQNRQGLRAMVFVNEFGKVEIDSTLVRWQGALDESRIVTLDNGCICCEVNSDLATQLQKILLLKREEVDYLVIETSGICDPGPVLETLERVDGLVGSTHVDSILAVVDAADFCEERAAPRAAIVVDMVEAAQAQVIASDTVLLNKCDLIGGPDSSRVCQVERALFPNPPLAALHLRRPHPRVIRTSHAAVDLSLITSLPHCGCALLAAPGSGSSLGRSGDAKRPRLEAHAGHALRTLAQSFVYAASRPFDPLKFESWVEAGGPPPSICRAKGLLWMTGCPQPVIFQLAGSRTNPFETLHGAAPPRDSRIVFIGKASAIQDGDEVAVTSALDACLC